MNSQVQVKLPFERPKRKCSIQPAEEDRVLETETQKLRASSSAPKVKKFTPLRVDIPKEKDCKLSDDLADCVRTFCKVCGSSFTLTHMRTHTLSQHQMQITKYKEVYGPFEIIEKVFHKCHICDKLVLLDSDALGGHIKGVHKMKEREYKEKYLTYSCPRSGQATLTSVTLEPKIKKSSGVFMKKSIVTSSRPEYDFKTTFPDFEYSCNLKHCELCEHGGVSVLLETIASSEVVMSEVGEDDDTADTTDTTVTGVGEVLAAMEEACTSVSVGQGGWSKKFLPTDIIRGELKDDFKDDANFHDDSIDYSEDSLVEESDSSSDSSEEELEEN